MKRLRAIPWPMRVAGAGVLAFAAAALVSTPAPLVGLFIAPAGNDANPGTRASPMRTILAASAKLTPGQTLWVRGGTYTGQGGYNWKSSGTASAPVTIKAYPGETPIFDGAGQSHGIIVSGFNHVVIDGLTFTGYGKSRSGDGSLMFIDATNLTVQNCTIRDSGVTTTDHSIYINSGTDDITIRNCTLYNAAGTHIVLNHPPGPRNVLIEGNRIGNPDGTEQAYGGVVVACSAAGSTATVRDNVFRNIGSNYLEVCRSAGASMTAIGNIPGDVVNGGPAD